MTKSRTIRKAGAVVLSLAMALSTLAIAPSADAAAKKPALASKKGTITEGSSKTVKIKNVTKAKVKKLAVKTSKKAVATVAKAGSGKKTAIKVTGKKAGKATITATVTLKKKVSGKTKFSLKYTATVKAKASTDDDGTTVTASLKLVDTDGLQTDGTAAVNDTLQVEIPATIGTIDRVNWYVDGKLLQATGNSATDTSKKADVAGVWQARVITTKGTTYESDTITVSATQVRATVSGFAIEDDYDDSIIDFDKDDTQAIVDVTINKDYSGDLYIYAEKDGKISGTAPVATITINGSSAKADSSKWTNHTLWAKNVATDATAGTKVAFSASEVNKYKNTDGSVTYRFFVIQAGKGKLTRGGSYIVLFDQDDVIDDDAKSTTPNLSNAFTAPYVKAPAKLVLNPISTAEKVSAKFVDDAGKTVEYMNVATNTSLAATGVSALDIYNYTDNTVSTTNGTKIAAGSPAAVIKGVYTSEDKGKDERKWYIAQAKLAKGIYGADEIPLTSDIASLPPEVAQTVTVAPKATDAKVAEVKFTNLLADATVYLVKGKASANGALAVPVATRVEKFSASDSTSYDAKVEVTKGAASVDIADAFSAVAVDATGNALDEANQYAVVVIPADQSTYSRKDSVLTGTLAQTIKSFELSGAPASATTAGAISATLKAIDQYGKEMKYTASTEGINSLDAAIDKVTTSTAGTAAKATIAVTDRTCTASTYSGGALTITLDIDSGTSFAKGDTFTSAKLSTGQKIKVTVGEAGDTSTAKVTIELVAAS